MKIPRTGPVWFLVVGIPLVMLSLAQFVAGTLRLNIIERTLTRWFEEIMEEYR